MTRFVIGCLLAATAAGAQDTIRVRGKEVPWNAARLPLTQLVAFGQVDGPQEYMFGAVEYVAADVRGRTYVFDRQAAQIRAYDERGKYLRNIGRKGAGPGEYREVYGLGIAHDTQLVVFDLTARVTYFQPDGTVARSVSAPRMTYGFDHGAAVTRDGMVLFRVMPRINGQSDIEMSAHEAPPPNMKVSPSFVVRMRGDGTLNDSLQIGSKTKFAPVFYVSTPDGGNSNFVPEFHAAASPTGGVVWGESDQYRIFIRDRVGRLRVIEQPWTAVELTTGERDNWQQYADYFRQRGGGRFTYTIPKTKPAFRDLTVGQDGRIWVSLYGPAQKRDIPPRPDRPTLFWRQTTVYDVFAPDGVHLGRVELPLNSRMAWAQGNRVWTIAKGADDEDRIVVYRVFTASDSRR